MLCEVVDRETDLAFLPFLARKSCLASSLVHSCLFTGRGLLGDIFQPLKGKKNKTNQLSSPCFLCSMERTSLPWLCKFTLGARGPFSVLGLFFFFFFFFPFAVVTIFRYVSSGGQAPRDAIWCRKGCRIMLTRKAIHARCRAACLVRGAQPRRSWSNSAQRDGRQRIRTFVFRRRRLVVADTCEASSSETYVNAVADGQAQRLSARRRSL